MDLTLVPFGYLSLQSKLVDVQQVPSGKRSGCQCPSCHAPLIARKGSKNVWHFAHDSKSELPTALEKCSYSLFVSARMMALQLIGDRLSLTLPKWEITLSEYLPMFERRVQVSETVTESREVFMENVSGNADIAGHSVDLLGYVSGYPLAIVFSHPERNMHWQRQDTQDEKAGVLEISLDALRDRFRLINSSKDSYGEVLEDYISNDVASKKWSYHPRFHHSETLAKSKLIVEIARVKKQSLSKLTKNVRQRPVFDDDAFKGIEKIQLSRINDKKYQFECRLCNSTWFVIGEDQASCRRCGTSLVVSRSEVIED